MNWVPWIPLLSGKSFDEFNPQSFKEHVRSLFLKRETRAKGSAAAKAKPKEVSFRFNRKGTLILRVNRNPQWISVEELAQLGKDSGKPENELFLLLKKRKIRISTAAAENQIRVNMDLPAW